jgi:hypothetical protein
MHKQGFVLLLLILLLGSDLLGQKKDNLFYQLKKEATSLFKAKEYTKAAEKYGEALEETNSDMRVEKTRYQACIAWTLSNNKEKAFKYLYQLVNEDYYTDFEELSLEPHFKSLHDDKRWEEIKVLIKKNINTIEALLPFYGIVIRQHFDPDEFAKEHIALDGEKVEMIPFRVSERYGFVSKKDPSKWLIKPTYEQVFAVYEDGAIVLDSIGRYLVVKPDGTLSVSDSTWYYRILKEGDLYHATALDEAVKSPEGIPIKSFDGNSSDYTRVIRNDYYDTNGNLIFSEKAQEYETFIGDDELAWFRYGKRYRIRNKSGELVKEFQHESLEGLFIGISDDLLIYLTTNDVDSTTNFVGKTLEEKIVFELPTRYRSSEGLDKYGYRGDRGVYKLSENFYGLQPQTNHEMHYSFCDSLGEERVTQGDFYTLDMLPIDVDYFSQEQFIVSNYKTNEKLVLNRQGDTIIPQPLLIGSSTVQAKYGRITRTAAGNYFCLGEDRSDLIDPDGNLIPRNDYIVEDKTKRIPWSQEKMDELKENGTSGYGLIEAFYSTYEFYQINVPVNPTENLHPSIARISMATDTTTEGKVRYSSIGAYVFYVNSKGETVLELPSDVMFAGYFSEGLAPAIDKNRGLGFVNLKGEWAISPKYEIAWIGGYPISLPHFPTFKGGYAYLRGFKGYVDKNGKEFFSGKRMQDRYNHSH